MSRVGGLYSISGVGQVKGAIVTVGKAEAETDFLKLVNLNCFGLKTMMVENPDIVNGPVRAYYKENGFDFDRLLRMLQS